MKIFENKTFTVKGQEVKIHQYTWLALAATVFLFSHFFWSGYPLAVYVFHGIIIPAIGFLADN